MNRYAFELSYDGTDFFGWQIQPNQISVQESIEECLTKLNSNNPLSIVGCGRTDTGVHAHHYVIHFDFPEIKNVEQFIYKLNKMLPESIAIQSGKQVDVEFHARFGATQRTYRYFIHQQKDPFKDRFSHYLQLPLDVEKMNEAAKLLLGEQDFTSLSKLHTDVKTNICTITKAQWIKDSQNTIYFEISADRFLRNMVRATVGTLLDVGLGKIQPQEVKAILDKKDRGEAGTSVPAKGLFLWKIEY